MIGGREGIPTRKSRSSLRRRILASVGAVVLISLLGSTFSLYRITEVNRSFMTINKVSMPLERLLVQMQADGDVLKREMERGLGYAHWKDPHWKALPLPGWIIDVMDREIDRANELLADPKEWDLPSLGPDEQAGWGAWIGRVSEGWSHLKSEAQRLHSALLADDREAAQQIYPAWSTSLETWKQELDHGVRDSERLMRDRFSQVQSSMRDLRTALQVILCVVVFLSLLLLWLGERALRPLADLTRLARQITERGLRRDDKAQLPEIPLSREDEVSQLAHEFRRMATALLEREKTVESHKNRLESQNRLLREMGELNKNILDSIESVLIVTDLDGVIAHCNPVALRWIGREEVDAKGQALSSFSPPHSLIGDSWPDLVARVLEKGEWVRLESQVIDGRTMGGNVMPLRQEGGGTAGLILVIDDLTVQLELEKRLRLAENLAAVGRMSAQVAHEVRNPLHSIGLETEIAIEESASLANPNLKQALQSIQAGVERLERITENYLKLSKLSAGERRRFRVDSVLEEVLAIYAPACENQRVSIDWSREKGAEFTVIGDPQLLEQALGNLFRNSLQALERSNPSDPRISWRLGNTESGRIWVRIEDNGPGLSESVKEKLFSPFVTTQAQGTGLGLSFVKQVIEEQGGEIRHFEPAEGASGAGFEILLPAALEVAVTGEAQANL